MLAPIFVPVLMQVGLSPELTQAAYRIGDSSSNIVTPLMPYFPLVVAFSQRWVKGTGIGTITSLMLPYSISLLGTWTLFLLAYWALGIPLGLRPRLTELLFSYDDTMAPNAETWQADQVDLSFPSPHIPQVIAMKATRKLFSRPPFSQDEESVCGEGTASSEHARWDTSTCPG